MRTPLALAALLALAPCAAADLLGRAQAPPRVRPLGGRRFHAVRPPLRANGDILTYVDLNTPDPFSSAVAVVGEEIWVAPRGSHRLRKYDAATLRFKDEIVPQLSGPIVDLALVHSGRYAGKIIAALEESRDVEIMDLDGTSAAGPFGIGGILSGDVKVIGIDAHPDREQYMLVDEGPDPDKPAGNALVWFLDAEFRAVRSMGNLMGLDIYLMKSACYLKEPDGTVNIVVPYGFQIHDGFAVFDPDSGDYIGRAMLVQWPDDTPVEAIFSGVSYDPIRRNLAAIGRFTDRLYLLDAAMEPSPAPIQEDTPEEIARNRIRFTWKNREPYDAIDVYENFQLLTTLPGTSTNFELVGAVGDEIVEFVPRQGDRRSLFTQIWSLAVGMEFLNDEWHFVEDVDPAGVAWDPAAQILLFAFEDSFILPVTITVDPGTGTTTLKGLDGFPSGLSRTSGIAVTPEGHLLAIDGRGGRFTRVGYLVDPGASPTTTWDVIEGPAAIPGARVTDDIRDIDGLDDGTYVGVNVGAHELVHFGADMAVLARVRRPEIVLGGGRQSPPPLGGAVASHNGILRLPGAPWWTDGTTAEIYWASGFEGTNPDRWGLPLGPGQGLGGVLFASYAGFDVIPELDRAVLLASTDGPRYCWTDPDTGERQCAYDAIVMAGGNDPDRAVDLLYHERVTLGPHERLETGPLAPTRLDPFFYVTVVNRSVRGPVPVRLIVEVGGEERSRDLPHMQRQSVLRRGHPGDGSAPVGVTLDNDYDLAVEFEVIVAVEGTEPVSVEIPFLRGDVDADGLFTVGDAIVLLNFLFAGGAAPPCPDAADYDDSGRFELGDAVALLNFQFAGGRPPADPGHETCGPDPTADDLGDCAYASCP